MDLREMIEHYLESEIDILKKLDTEAVQKVVKAFEEAYERESAIYVFGNGGSAGTASHMANDFNKGISEYTEKKFRFQCLNDNIPTMLAVANDIGYDDVFSFQLKNKVKEKDLVIGISGSGNSENVIRALDCAKEQGAITMGIVGYCRHRVSCASVQYADRGGCTYDSESYGDVGGHAALEYRKESLSTIRKETGQRPVSFLMRL